MAVRELLLQRIPSLSEKAVGARQLGRAKIKERHERQRKHKGQIIFTYPPMPHVEPWLEVPSLEHLARLARRETILQRQKEKPTYPAKGQELDNPALVAENACRVVTDYGVGWLPYQSNHRLRAEGPEKKPVKLDKIKKIYVIQHGVLRNAVDYYDDFIEALKLKENYDPETTLIIAPQFLAPVDVKPSKHKPKNWQELIARERTFAFLPQEEFLQWRYNDWRGAEPAKNPNAPIDSFTAMDQLLRNILRHTPNAETIEFRGNSEGAQFLDRYLAYSKELKRIEAETDVTVHGVISNAGTQHFFDSFRPVFDKQGKIIDWRDYGFESDENLWPLGLYDPPPYILESLHEDYGDSPYGPFIATLDSYLRRITLGIGTADSLKQASHLPRGKGYIAQGETRLDRYIGKRESLDRLIRRYRRKGIYLPQLKLLEAIDFGHTAGPMLLAANMARDAQQRIYGADDKID